MDTLIRVVETLEHITKTPNHYDSADHVAFPLPFPLPLPPLFDAVLSAVEDRVDAPACLPRPLPIPAAAAAFPPPPLAALRVALALGASVSVDVEPSAPADVEGEFDGSMSALAVLLSVRPAESRAWSGWE